MGLEADYDSFCQEFDERGRKEPISAGIYDLVGISLYNMHHESCKVLLYEAHRADTIEHYGETP